MWLPDAFVALPNPFIHFSRSLIDASGAAMGRMAASGSWMSSCASSLVLSIEDSERPIERTSAIQSPTNALKSLIGALECSMNAARSYSAGLKSSPSSSRRCMNAGIGVSRTLDYFTKALIDFYVGFVELCRTSSRLCDVGIGHSRAFIRPMSALQRWQRFALSDSNAFIEQSRPGVTHSSVPESSTHALVSWTHAFTGRPGAFGRRLLAVSFPVTLPSRGRRPWRRSGAAFGA